MCRLAPVDDLALNSFLIGSSNRPANGYLTHTLYNHIILIGPHEVLLPAAIAFDRYIAWLFTTTLTTHIILL